MHEYNSIECCFKSNCGLLCQPSIYVMQKLWIGTIHGMPCTNFIPELQVQITHQIGCPNHGLLQLKSAEYGLMAKPSITWHRYRNSEL